MSGWSEWWSPIFCRIYIEYIGTNSNKNKNLHLGNVEVPETKQGIIFRPSTTWHLYDCGDMATSPSTLPASSSGSTWRSLAPSAQWVPLDYGGQQTTPRHLLWLPQVTVKSSTPPSKKFFLCDQYRFAEQMFKRRRSSYIYALACGILPNPESMSRLHLG